MKPINVKIRGECQSPFPFFRNIPPNNVAMPSQKKEDSKVGAKTIISLWADLHQKKGELWLPVLSGSMLPLLNIGDNVLVQSIEPSKVKPGDIIVFRDLDRFIVHRVIKTYKNEQISFLQKGDNAKTAEIVSGENLIGMVTLVHKRNRLIYLNHGAWKIFNYFLIFFSFSVYYLKPGNPVLKMIARFLFNKIVRVHEYVK
jgi:signal peptidase I